MSNRNYNVLPGPKMGVVTLEYLEKLVSMAKKHNIPLMKLTGAQRFAIAGHSPEAAGEIWREFGQDSGPKKPAGIHYVQACPGVKWCKYGRQDSLLLGEKLHKALGEYPLPAKTKVGVSGCPMNCCESYVRDLGFFGKKKGWSLVFGGNGGGCPRIGDVIAEGLDDTQAIELGTKCLDFYRQRARKFERSGRFMRRTPLAELKSAVLDHE